MKKKIRKLFAECCKNMGGNYFYRVLTAVYLFDFLDRLRALGYPKNWFSLLENEMKQLAASIRFFENSFEFPKSGLADRGIEDKALEDKTGKVYFDLWKNFRKEEFFAEALKNISERFEKNDISVKNTGRALDDGCGSGRYSFALKKLGCKYVAGIDVSAESVKLARKMNPFPASKVSFVRGSVLGLPFKDGTFDFVFSNGVLHHTSSTEKGLNEIYRVLKKGGSCWLYLYGGKDSLFWDIVDFCRRVLSPVPQAYTQTLMRELGYSPGRIFHRIDFFYVPVHNRYFQTEVEKMLKNAGFSDIRRLERGTEFDWDEIIYRHPRIDPYIFGEGEMRYIIYK